MSNEQDHIRSIAGRIADRLSQEATERTTHEENSKDVGSELAALRAGLSEIQKRLAHIEAHVTHDDTCDPVQSAKPSHHQGENTLRQMVTLLPTAASTPSPWLSGTYVPAAHPSEERFDIGEAVSELVDYFEREKICNMEPGEKPCDHCGACSSRGF